MGTKHGTDPPGHRWGGNLHLVNLWRKVDGVIPGDLLGFLLGHGGSWMTAM